jgi:hypothetical protein
MTNIILDTNIYDRLEHKADLREVIADLIDRKRIVVLVSPTIRDELTDSHFGGVPEWFPIQEIPESVFIIGYTRWGEGRLGDGSMYQAHKGVSKKIKDAAIADTATIDADVLVSEDRRLRSRFARFTKSGKPMTFAQFESWIGLLEEALRDQEE